jgi:hypothetical protein
MVTPMAEFDSSKPSIARVYDYLLGGKDNFPADRAVGDVFVDRFPGAVAIARDNRTCMARAVRYVSTELGIGQFLDLGSGMPTAGNVHQIARSLDPDARVVYADIDPVVLSHGKALLGKDEQTVVIEADVRDPGALLASPQVRELLDFTRPVAVFASAVLHHLTDDEDPQAVIDTVKAAVPSGSALFVSHFRTLSDPESAAMEKVLQEAFGRGSWRTDEQIGAYFSGLRLIDPGVVPCALWHTDAADSGLTGYQRLIAAGLAVK